MKRAMIGVVFLLSFEVVYLSVRNHELIRVQKRLEAYLSTTETIPKDNDIKLGLVQMADWQTGKTFDILDYQEGQAAIIFNLSTTCSLCDEASAYWNAIDFKYGHRYRIFGLTRDYREQIAQYVERNNIRFPIFNILRADHSIDSVIGRTPRTILVDREGSVSEVFEGLAKDLDKKLSKRN